MCVYCDNEDNHTLFTCKHVKTWFNCVQENIKITKSYNMCLLYEQPTQTECSLALLPMYGPESFKWRRRNVAVASTVAQGGLKDKN